MTEELPRLLADAQKQIDAVEDFNKLKKLETSLVGPGSTLKKLMADLSQRPLAERRIRGSQVQDVRNAIVALVREKEERLKVAQPLTEPFDPTVAATPHRFGSLHPIERFIRLIEDFFVAQGFAVLAGPEVEQARYNFDLLNIPKNHPSRDVWDTFYVSGPGNLVLRTHTSPMQIRAMEKRKPPVRLIVPGRVFRHEATDASHEAMFYQVEGLVIDRGVRMTDLIGTLVDLVRAIFGTKVKYRLRPHFYPFVEPGMDLDMARLTDQGIAWLEMLGSGMVHPKVLKNMGVDPKKYSGYAFGLGIDRWMMLYYGIADIRSSYRGDLEWLKQF